MLSENKNTVLVNRIQEKRKCKRSSCRVYASNLRKVHNEFSSGNFTADLKWLGRDSEKIMKGIRTLKNNNTRLITYHLSLYSYLSVPKSMFSNILRVTPPRLRLRCMNRRFLGSGKIWSIFYKPRI